MRSMAYQFFLLSGQCYHYATTMLPRHCSLQACYYGLATAGNLPVAETLECNSRVLPERWSMATTSYLVIAIANGPRSDFLIIRLPLRAQTRLIRATFQSGNQSALHRSAILSNAHFNRQSALLHLSQLRASSFLLLYHTALEQSTKRIRLHTRALKPLSINSERSRVPADRPRPAKRSAGLVSFKKFLIKFASSGLMYQVAVRERVADKLN